MMELARDGATWNRKDDVSDAFFSVVGAPSWHGRNLDALNDSIANDQIHEVEFPIGWSLSILS
jgi:RNAse (barnase) inhibitor barstar